MIKRNDKSLRRELVCRQLPLSATLFVLGICASLLQHGFVIGGSAGVPLSGTDAHVPFWFFFPYGLIAGYIMALVGQATGAVSVPFYMSVLGFESVNLSPTVQVESFLGPLGAISGRRNRESRIRKQTGFLCAGAIPGGIAGPILRATFFADSASFAPFVGIMLIVLSANMWFAAYTLDTSPEKAREHADRNRSLITRAPMVMMILGMVIALFSTIIGVGGGFLLVPMLILLFRMDMTSIPEISIPYIVSLSVIGVFGYVVILPLTGRRSIMPEWGWSFFVAGSAVIGSWLASKTRHHVPERFLRILLGVLTGSAGVYYIVRAILVA